MSAIAGKADMRSIAGLDLNVAPYALSKQGPLLPLADIPKLATNVRFQG
jgi:hypothetical protein